MALYIFDKDPTSPGIRMDPPTYIEKYKAIGEDDENSVMGYAIAATPVSVFTNMGQLWRQSIDLDRVGHQQYAVNVPYGKRNRTTGTASWSFDTTGGTTKIKASRRHVASYTASGIDTSNPCKGAIGVDKATGHVEGADVIIPALKLNYQFKHPLGIVTESFARLLARNTGKTNSVAWRGFDVGELLYLGSTGADGTDADADISYLFAASENADGLSIGSITDILKGGWEYVWVEFAPDVLSGEAVVVPVRVYVEEVYRSFNFASVFGWE